MSTPGQSSNAPLDSARNGPMSSGRSNRPSLSIGSHISLDKERGLITALAVLFVAMGVVALLACEEAFRAWRTWSGYQLFAVGCFAPIAALASLISALGSFKSLQDLREKDQLVLKVKGVVGEDVLLFGLYLTLFAFAGCAVLGACCLFNQEEIEMVLTAQFADPAVAAALYPNTSLQVVTDALHSAYAVCGYLCFAYVLLALVAFFIQLALSLDHETTHSIVQVESLVLLCVGLFIVLTGGFSMKVKVDFDWEELPISVLKVAVGIGLAACALAMYGFFVGKWEDRMHAHCFGEGSLVFAVVAVWFITMQLQDSDNIQKDLRESCLDTMALVDARYLQSLGCTQKYLHPAPTATDLTCPKEQIRHIWEDLPPDAPSYGCLNPDCCGYFIASTKIVLDYMAVAILVAAVIGVLACVSSCVLTSKISQKGPSMFHNTDGKILLAMGLVVVLGVGLIYAMIPFTPRAKPDIKPMIAVDSAGAVDPRLATEGTCIRGPLLTVRPYMFACPSCDKSTLQANITAESGTLYITDVMGVNVTSRKPDFAQVEGRDMAALTKSLQSVVFCSRCPLSGGRLNITLTRRDYAKRSSLRLLQSSNSTEKQQFDLKGEEVLFRRSFSMSFASPGDQVFNSSVEYDGNGIKGVTVHAYSSGSDCFSVKTQTDPLGDWAISAPRTANLSPYALVLDFSAPGYIGTTISTQIGGLPLHPQPLPSITLQETSKTLGSVSVSVFEGLKNRPAANATVAVRSGMRNTTGTVYMRKVTDESGVAVFRGLPAGDYTVASDDGYFVDSVDVRIGENKTYAVTLSETPMSLSKDQLRVVLTWQRSDIDLDLRVAFDSTPAHRCTVYYADKHCGGAKLYSLSDAGTKGGEALTLKDVSASHYLFYVTSSKAGDFQSAEVKVYSPSSAKAIFTLKPSAPVSTSGNWLAFCLHGPQGPESLSILDQVRAGAVSPSVCDQFYGSKHYTAQTWPADQNVTRIGVRSALPPTSPMFVLRPGN